MHAARKAHITFFAAALMIVVTGISPASAAYTEQTLYKFCNEKKCGDGKTPLGLTMDGQGNIFGVTEYGPSLPKHNPGYGIVFEYSTATGAFHVVYGFCSEAQCADGSSPAQQKLVIDSSGNLYGTTFQGGSCNDGVAFRLLAKKAGWQYQILHSFCGQDGALPQAGLAYAGEQTGAFYDGISTLYGTTSGGGSSNGGTVFTLHPEAANSKKWKEKALYSFCSLANCVDGAGPIASVNLDEFGNIFGTATSWGQLDGGVVFELIDNHGKYSETVLYNFCSFGCADGSSPESALLIDRAGNMFGTTLYGGSNNTGLIYELILKSDGSRQYEILVNFDGEDGLTPSSLILGEDGSLFGTTVRGGEHDLGIVFQYNGAMNTLYNSCSEAGCADGEQPYGLLQDSDGNLFGVTLSGGSGRPRHTSGTLFELINNKSTRRATQ